MNAQSVLAEFQARSKPLTKAQWEEEKRFSPTRLDVRRITKADYQYLVKDFLRDLAEKEQAEIWLEVFEVSPIRTLDSIAIDFFKLRQKRKTFDLMNFANPLYEWPKKIDCWITGDMLASLTSQIHEADPKRFYPKLSQWSRSRSPWLNRMSLLSLYYYSSCRRSFPSFKQSIDLVELHLHKDHYYLQKSVGWTLREMNNVYPEPTQKWIEKNIEILSSQAFTTATEKLKGDLKASWKLRRTRNRQAQKTRS